MQIQPIMRSILEENLKTRQRCKRCGPLRKLVFSDRLVSTLNFEQQVNIFSGHQAFIFTCKLFELENSHSPPQSGSVLQRKCGGDISIQIRIKLTFTGPHFYKH